MIDGCRSTGISNIFSDRRKELSQKSSSVPFSDHTGSFVIGRATTCHMVFSDPAISSTSLRASCQQGSQVQLFHSLEILLISSFVFDCFPRFSACWVEDLFLFTVVFCERCDFQGTHCILLCDGPPVLTGTCSNANLCNLPRTWCVIQNSENLCDASRYLRSKLLVEDCSTLGT